jgi:hypothetical protein
MSVHTHTPTHTHTHTHTHIYIYIYIYIYIIGNLWKGVRALIIRMLRVPCIILESLLALRGIRVPLYFAIDRQCDLMWSHTDNKRSQRLWEVAIYIYIYIYVYICIVQPCLFFFQKHVVQHVFGFKLFLFVLSFFIFFKKTLVWCVLCFPKRVFLLWVKIYIYVQNDCFMVLKVFYYIKKRVNTYNNL